ncbi:MAG: hypothetical protein GXY35_11290 [Chlamydiae bacterium]|nr:hypothetical protein [Chlamydiota bacterium]
MNTTARRHACLLLLLVLVVLCHALCNWRYLAGDLYPQQKDVAAHLKVCTKYLLQSRDAIRSGAPLLERFTRLASLFHQESIPVEHIWIWPRLTYVVTAPAAAIWGLTPRVIILSNIVWLAVLLLSVFSIGSRCMSPEAGFMAALITSLFPATYGLSRNYGLDFSLMGIAALAVYWLIRTEAFSRRAPSIVFGCVFGIGLLVKVQLLIFLCGPLLFALVCGWRRSRDRGITAGRVFANVALAGLAALLLSIPFWWGNIDNIAAVFIRHAEARDGIDPHHLSVPVMSARYFAYYLVAAIVYVSPPLFALGVLLLPVFILSRFKARAVVLLWALVPYAMFTLIELKYSVFYLSSLPAVGVVIGAGLASLRTRALKYFLCAAAAGWGLIHFLQLSFAVGPPPYRGCRPYSSDALRADGYPVWAHPAFPNNLERVARRFIEEIGSHERGNRYVRIGVCEFEYSNKDYLLVDSLEYFMESVNPAVYVFRSHFSTDSFLECMDSFNYLVVLEEGDKPMPDFRRFEEYFSNGSGASLCAKYLNGPATLARLIESYRRYELLDRELLYPDGVSAFLMRKPPFPVEDDAVIPAAHLVSANVFIAWPRIGVDERLRRPPTIGDYDVLFPYDLEFPLVPPARRDPSEPYFARYRLSFERGGTYALSIKLKDREASPPRASVNGKPVIGRHPREANGGMKRIGSFRVQAGVGEVELLGDEYFSVTEQLRITREGE